MRYIGGKHRLAPKFVPVLLQDAGPAVTTWVEPFVGSGSVIKEVPAALRRIGVDGNPYAIALLKACQQGYNWPDVVTEEDWRRWRDHYRNGDCDLMLTKGLCAFVGWGCSYAARWFEGYARAPKSGTNYAASAKRNLEKLRPKIEGVELFVSDYRDLTYLLRCAKVENPEQTVLYLDPPYADGFKASYYKDALRPGEKTFDSEEFWQWALDAARQGFKVYVSEFTAPSFARPIWQITRACSLDKNTGRKVRIDTVYKVEA